MKKKYTLKFSPVFLSLMSMLPYCEASAQDIVVDSSQINGPGINTTANGTPMIQIADPNQQGISHNKFTEFNVNNPGVVFNNSMTDGVSKIGGVAIKNPNLTQAATGIISEVTGASSSRLEGTLEVFGNKADLIIANENGIIVNGVSTINAGNLTLSTGKIVEQKEGNFILSVDKGNVTIGSGGVSTDGMDYFDIVSRGATVQGKISGNSGTKILTGLNDYDLKNRVHTVRSGGDNETPEVAISGSSMGSMYGNRIQLISTESGAGVRHEGSIVSINDIEISASGDISLAGLQAGRDIIISGESVSTRKNADGVGGLNAKHDLFLTSLGGLTINSDLISETGKIRINAGSLLHKAAIIQANNTSANINVIEINVIGNYTLSGALLALDASNNAIANAVITLRNGAYVVTVDGKEVSYSSIVSDVAVNARQGDISIQSGSLDNHQGSLIADTGKVTFNVSDVFSSSGLVKAQGNITLVSRSLINKGIAYSSSALEINVTDLVNSGALSAKNKLSLSATQTAKNSGLLYSDQSVAITSATLANTGEVTSGKTTTVSARKMTNEGKFNARTDLNLNVSGGLANIGSGEIVSGNNLAVTGENTTVENSGAAVIQANNIIFTDIALLENSEEAQLLASTLLSVERLKNLDNRGVIQGGSLVLKDISSLDNEGKLLATDTLLLLANHIINKDIIQAGGALSVQASEILNTGGSIQTDKSLSINADQLTNAQSANLSASGDLVLALGEALNNSASLIAAGETLTIKGSDDVRTLTFVNESDAEINASAIVIADVNKLINNVGLIGSSKSITINNVGSLANKEGDSCIQGATISISDVDVVSNNGLMIAKNILSLAYISTLNNNGEFASEGLLDIKNVDTFSNAGGVNVSGNVNISDVTEINNDGEITAAENLTLSVIGNVNNNNSMQAASLLEIKEINTLKNNGLIVSGNKLTIQDIVDFINSANSDDGLDAQVMAENEMVIQHISKLVNSGDTALINAFGQLSLLDVAQLANSEQAIISGDTVLLLDKIGILSNLSGANILSQNGSITITADSIVNSGYSEENIYNSDGHLTNQKVNESNILALNDLMITTESLRNSNKAGLYSQRGDMTLSISALTNEDAVISGDAGTVTISVDNGTATNSKAVIIAQDLILNADMLINNLDASISALDSLYMKVNQLQHSEGKIQSSGKLQLDLNDDYEFSQNNLLANSQLIINASGNITNAFNQESYASLILNAGGDFTNKTGGALVSAQDIGINATNFINEEDTLVWALGNVNVDVRNGSFINNQNGNVYSNKTMSLIARMLENFAGTIKSGKDMEIDAENFSNKSKYNEFSWSFDNAVGLYGTYKSMSGLYTQQHTAYMKLQKWQSDIKMLAKADIRSGGSLKINQRDIFTSGSVTNKGGAISASTDISIRGDIYNGSEYTSMSLYEYLMDEANAVALVHTKYYGVLDKESKGDFNTLFDMLDYVYGSGSPSFDNFREEFYYTLIHIEKGDNPFEQVMTTLFGETWRNLSRSAMQGRWSKLISSDNAAIKSEMIYFLPDDAGSITAGGSFFQKNGSLVNGLGGDVVQVNTVVEVEVGDKTVKTAEAHSHISVNTKRLAEISLGISSIAGIKELTSIPGMFGYSDAFNLLITEMNADNLGSSGATVIIGDSTLTLVPMYESRLSMLDQSKFYGSDYFFQQIGYTSANPVTVIGDGYFIQELITRQINNSVGSFFAVRDALDGEALTKELMDNAALVSDKLGLVVGKALTEEQLNNLDEDIVWFVSNSVNGYDVLVPVIYLSVKSQTQLREQSAGAGSNAVIHADKNIDIDATSIVNSNAVISAGGDAHLKSEGDIIIASSGQDGGVVSGGNMSIDSAEGNITLSGSYLSSGGDININAKDGDVEFIASTGRDEDGNQKLNSNKDNIAAGRNLNISGKNVTINAVDMTVGSDASITATDGDVSYNALSEITSDRNIDFESTWFLSNKTTDSQSISSKAKTSNVTAGGKLSINASNDINIEGSEMTAKSGNLQAGNNLTISTAQDTSWQKTTVEKTELLFELEGSGSGYSGNISASSVEGVETTSNTSGTTDVTPGATLKIGVQKTAETTESLSTVNHNASFNFSASGEFSAGDTVDIGGGDFSMDEMTIDARTLASTKYLDEIKKSHSYSKDFIGYSAEVRSVLLDVESKYAKLFSETKNGEKEVNVAATTASVAGDVTKIIFDDVASVSITQGYERKEGGAQTYSASENITNINVNKLKIKSRESSTLNGTVINANSVDVETGDDFNINAAKSYEASASWSATNKGGTNVSAGAGVTGVGVGASLEYSHDESQAEESSVKYKNSQINAGNISVKTGGDMSMSGANMNADTVDTDIAGDLNITSLQDTKNSSASSWKANVSVGMAVSTRAVIPTFSVGGGGGNERYDQATVGEQSGIKTSGSANIKTGKDLNITGGYVISENNTGKVSVGGDINAVEIEDSIEQDGTYGGGSVGIDKNVTLTVGGYIKNVDTIRYKETQKTTISVGETDVEGKVNGNLNSDASNMSEVTENKVYAGNDISFKMSGNFGGKENSDSKADTTSEDGGKTKPDTTSVDGGKMKSDTTSVNGGKTKSDTTSVDGGKTKPDTTSVDGGKTKPDTTSVNGGKTKSDTTSVNGGKTKPDTTSVNGGKTKPDTTSVNGGKTKSDTTSVNGGKTKSDTTSVNGGKTKSDTTSVDGGKTKSDTTSVNGGKTKPDTTSVDGGKTKSDTTSVNGGQAKTDTKSVDAGNTTSGSGKNWTLTPQGNLKGGSNVPVKDSNTIRNGRNKWQQEYNIRNNQTGSNNLGSEKV